MEFSLEMNSTAGMVQLIKYFESQSERLDKQTIQPHSACLGSNFESLIKFNGVPILPPAMTASRREKFKQFKREAVFREKRLKARQRRTAPKSDYSTLDLKDRPTARQLNFDSELPSEANASSSLQHRLGATNPLSTFATAETEGNTEDFGMRTMDSLASDLASLEEGTLPTVFSGHTLKSVKEQKISFNLDHLCKELKIQDLGSTSGSDLSDVLLNTNTLDGDLIRGERWAEKIIAHNAAAGGQGQTTSFFHDSQDTVVEVSPEAGITSQNTDHASSSGFGDKTEQSNLEQTQTSIGSSPGCGSTTTTDSQKSKVHFASFIYEYNTSASQSFDSAAIVKKKMSPDNTGDDEGKVISRRGHGVSFSSSHDTRHKVIPSNKAAENEGAGGLLNRVSLQHDSESSPGTPPFETTTGVPFKNYTRNDSYNSDKENEEHRATKVSPKLDSNKYEAQTSYEQSGNISRSRSAARRLNMNDNQPGNHEDGDLLKLHGVNPLARFGIGSASGQSFPHLGSEGEMQLSCDSSDLISVSQVSLSRPGGVLSLGKHSVSDSNASSKSMLLSTTSGSSSSTLKEDLTPKESTDLGLNIVDMENVQINFQQNGDKDNGDVNERPYMDQGGASPPRGEKTSVQKDSQTYSQEEFIHSPKKLNVGHQLDAEELPKEMAENPIITPSKSHIRRGSYTLSEPSPVLIQAKSKLEAEKKRKSEAMKGAGARDEDKLPLQKKLDFDDAQDDTNAMISVPSGAEKEGKAEHINKYLSQVQFQNSMNLQSQSLDHESDENCQNEDVPYQEFASSSSVIEVLRSIAESTGSLGQLSDVELQSLQQQQMELARKALIGQQNRDMEELFIQQRKEIMMFENEIKSAQQQHLEQHKFIVHNAPENIKIKARNHKEEFSPESSANFMDVSKQGTQIVPTIKNSMNSLNNMRQRPVSRSSQSESQGGLSLNLQPKMYPGKSSLAMNLAGANSNSHSTKYNAGMNVLSLQEQTYVKTIDDDTVSSKQKQVLDPVGQIPEFSSPSTNSPRMHRPMMFKSPHLYADIHRKARQVVIPPEALRPEMKAKFNRVSAVAKGFLTRCLLRSDKVQELTKTIKDTREFANNFQTETPIKKGVFTAQDRGLLERIIAQLQAALLDIHEIFFEIPSAERMSLIEHTRIVEYDKRMKASRDSTRASGPRISQATLKALERKRKAREAEASAILSSTARPKSASSSSNSPRCQNHTDLRVLKPLQGQGHASFHHHSSSSDKDRPHTAPEKQLTRPKRMTVQTSKPAQSSVITAADSSSREVNKKATVSSNAKTVTKSKVAPSKPAASRPSKSWR